MDMMSGKYDPQVAGHVKRYGGRRVHERVVKVYVEGYEDVSFWRSIFDRFVYPEIRFEISVPPWKDLPKGKNVLMHMVDMASDDTILCCDADFDYLFEGETPQSERMLGCRNMFHTYAYATENYLCYAPSLHNICVKATKNDTRIFDFVRFMEEYSTIVYPVFLWYAYSAKMGKEHMLVLSDFRNCVRIGFLDLKDNGRSTLDWLKGNVSEFLKSMEEKYPEQVEDVCGFGKRLAEKGVIPRNTYLFMHGHTLMDNVVMVLLETVCNRLMQMSLDRISKSSKKGVALKNELSNYRNSLRTIGDVLLDNENFESCFLYRRLHNDLEEYIRRLRTDF